MKALLEALQDRDLWVRYFAARSLGNFDHPRVVQKLSEVVDTETHDNVRIAALEALGKVGGNVAIRTIESYVEASYQMWRGPQSKSLQNAQDKHKGEKDRDH